MGKITGFLEYNREGTRYRCPQTRTRDWNHVQLDSPDEQIQRQAARCMDCGIPFCIDGCPLGNIIPDWNDLTYREKTEEALVRLHATNNFPEFTGLVCPAPCEAACVLGINDDPVTIKQIEWEIVRRGWERGSIQPRPPLTRSNHSVAVVGSGPAGLAAAQQLNRAGHRVTVFEKNERIGGLLRFGIPDFKLAKEIIDRRLAQLEQEGVAFRAGVDVGVDVSVEDLRSNFDAILLCLGCEQPRDLPVEGRALSGIHFAMDFLSQQNRRVAGRPPEAGAEILATDKHVVVLGGGDTGSDCVGTALRQGAKSVTSIELLEQPPDQRSPTTPWPQWPLLYRTSSSHEEGGHREFAVLTRAFTGSEGRVTSLHAARIQFGKRDASGRAAMEEIPGSALEIPADLVLLAMGFTGSPVTPLFEELGVQLDERGIVVADPRSFTTSEPGVFAAGDCRRGQSLVVWAISEGREAARAVDRHLTNRFRPASCAALS
jgi:glutamate synthase (NADPH/NADH) small chain